MTDRAVAGYDEKHEYDLVDAITTAIAETSMISHANAMVIGTGETASAFLSCLATILAMSPSAVRTPAAIRKAIEELGNASARCKTSSDALSTPMWEGTHDHSARSRRSRAISQGARSVPRCTLVFPDV
jgi:hypothetical protein